MEITNLPVKPRSLNLGQFGEGKNGSKLKRENYNLYILQACLSQLLPTVLQKTIQSLVPLAQQIYHKWGLVEGY